MTTIDDDQTRPAPAGSPVLSRRLLFTGAAAGALTLGLAGCGTSDPGGTPSGNAVTIPGKEGTATIPGTPERVVCVGYQRDTDEAISLGIAPVGITPYVNFPDKVAPWVQDKIAEIKPVVLDYQDTLPYERIASLGPDLILATDSYGLAAAYPELSRIAPTLSYAQSVAQDTWQSRATRIGQALGRDEQATRLVADTEKRIKAAAASNPAFAGKSVTFSLVNSSGQFATVQLPSDASITFLSQLGFRLAPAIAKLPAAGPQGRGRVSEEQLGILDADLVLFSYRNEKQRRQVEQNPLFRRIPAVQQGRYVGLDVGTAVAMAFPSTLSIPFAVDRVVPQLASAVQA